MIKDPKKIVYIFLKKKKLSTDRNSLGAKKYTSQLHILSYAGDVSKQHKCNRCYLYGRKVKERHWKGVGKRKIVYCWCSIRAVGVSARLHFYRDAYNKTLNECDLSVEKWKPARRHTFVVHQTLFNKLIWIFHS